MKNIIVILATLISILLVSCKPHICEWDEGQVLPGPCTEVREKVYCFKTRTEIIPATEHPSYKSYKCSVCGQWGLGPSSGYVFYDCDADNDFGNTDGLISSECGWRYLEAAPEDLGAWCFGFYRTKDDGENNNVGTESAIGKGKNNTEALVVAMKGFTYANASGSSQEYYAAQRCVNQSITVDGVVYDDWFLPSEGELNLMYVNLHENGLGSFSNCPYWSSSESGDSSINAREIDFSNGSSFFSHRSVYFSVRPIRAF